MELKDYFEISTLLGYYRNLLSKKQKEYMIEHFENDYSLSEIAEDNGVSRQAIFENIKRGIKILRDYEEKLGIYNRDKKLKEKLNSLSENLTQENLEKIIKEL